MTSRREMFGGAAATLVLSGYTFIARQFRELGVRA